MKTFKRNFWLIIILPVLFALTVLNSCQTGMVQPAAEPEMETAIPETADEVRIEMRNTRFNPRTLSIKQGTTVIWTNEDSIIHTVTSGTRNNESGIFDSGNMSGGQTFSYTFNDKGTFDYFCRPHPGMDGTIIVE